jgi:hypothetical protein
LALKVLNGLQEHRIRNHAQLQSIEVFTLGDGPLAVGDIAEAQVEETQE